MIAHVCACTGWTWNTVVTELDFPRLKALNNYWESHPPTHLMIAAYLGIKPRSPQPSTPVPPSEEQFEKVLETFPTGPAPVYMTTEEYKLKRAERMNHE